MARGAAGSSSREDDQGNLQAHADHKASKRRCVQSACVPCRRRKSKCDGGLPVCATCTAVYKTECYYDVEGESRRSKPGSLAVPSASGTKPDVPLVKPSGFENPSNAEAIIKSLQELPHDQSYELFQLIRSDPPPDLTTFANWWPKTWTHSSSTPLNIRNLEEDFSLLLGEATTTAAKGKRQLGYSPTLGLFFEEEDDDLNDNRTHKHSAIQEQQGTAWTSVTSDLDLVEKLLSLYFTWSHSFYALFVWECFYKDFRAGRAKYCSSLLVNAICAFASHFMDDPACQTDPSNSRTAGDRFFAEAERQLFEDGTSNLTTAQALCVISMRESSAGRDSSGFKYIGRSIRMCVELGLHLDKDLISVSGLTPSEIEARKTTFWGCFTVDTFSSGSMRGISQLPRPAITLTKPVSGQSASLSKAFPEASRFPPDILTSRLFLQAFASFSELANDNNHMFFTSKEHLTSIKILNIHNRYQTWFGSLPPMFAEVGGSVPAPHVILLHMLYYSMIIHLFRPMLILEPIDSNISAARKISIDAANDVSRLFRLYRSSTSFHVAHLPIPQILLSACIVHLLYPGDNETARQHLSEGLRGLEDLHECHYVAAKSFRIMHRLAKTRNLFWPEELRNSNLISKNYREDAPQGPVGPPTDPRLVAPNRETTESSRGGSNVPYLPIGHPHTKQSLSVFGQEGLHSATHPIPSRLTVVVPSQHYDTNLVSHTPAQTAFNPTIPSPPYHYHHSASSVPGNASSTTTPPTRDAIDNAFWHSIPNISGPIQPHTKYQHADSMGAESVLQSADTDTRFRRSGFTINQDWRSQDMDNFSSGGVDNVYAAHNNHIDVSFVRGESDYVSGTRVTYQHSPHDGHVHNSHHEHSQDVYDASWWPNANSNSDQRH